MKTAIIALTRCGAELALKIAYAMDTDVYIKNNDINKNGFINRYVLNGKMILVHPFTTGFKKMVEKIFAKYEGLVFIMACGIVVRSIAPYLKGKSEDPAVVVVDEMGRFAISLLSGHMGGANKLAGEISAVAGAVPVITTATDIHNVIAFDIFACENDCVIENTGCLKHISSELVNGGKVSLYSDCNLRGILPGNVLPYEKGQKCKRAVVLSNREDVPVAAEKVLLLRPKNLIMGIGCKKGKSRDEIEAAVMDFLKREKRSILSVRRIASIDLKSKEPGIVDFCLGKGIEFVTYRAEKIKLAAEKFSNSEFVKKVTGVGNVAESCAVIAGEKAKLVCPKTIYSGITLALAEEERSYYI